MTTTSKTIQAGLKLPSVLGPVQDKQLISALHDKRVHTISKIAELQKAMDQHRAELDHINAVLRIFAPDLESGLPSTPALEVKAPAKSRPARKSAKGTDEAARGRRPRKKHRTRYFRRGELPVLCLEVMRSFRGTIMSSEAVAEGINRLKGFDAPTDYRSADSTQTRPVLRALAKQGIVRRIGSGKGSKWQLV